jgi:carboxynorspermidine decarboxylase
MEQFGKIKLSEKQLHEIHTPCFIVNEVKLEENLKTLAKVQEATDAKILLGMKGFAMWSVFPLIEKYLPGVSASSLNEALLGYSEFRGELHVYAPAYTERDFQEILEIADHITFNSVSQWQKYQRTILNTKRKIQCAVRINPEHSEVKTKIYDPCAPLSRLGITIDNFKKHEQELEGINGLHFHNLCELNADSLERTLEVVEKNFGFYFDHISWINFGGGHHITRSDYDVDKLIEIINTFKEKYQLDVYLEPGEAIALNTGVLVSKVEDIFHNGMNIAILDTSATAHMPDVLEMPYRPLIENAGEANEKQYTYRLGGMTCLAGDVIGDYSFDKPLQEGDTLVFGDMAHYSMVKTTTFNGVNLPSIYTFNSDSGELNLQKRFGFEDYRNRLS